MFIVYAQFIVMICIFSEFVDFSTFSNSSHWGGVNFSWEQLIFLFSLYFLMDTMHEKYQIQILLSSWYASLT